MTRITFLHTQVDNAKGSPFLTLEQVVEQAKREAVLAALKRNHKNVAQAARELGISRVTLYRLIDKNHLNQDRQERQQAD
ncbi:MAG TPA: helix-turn-helix domain-containing protein [Burkholderiales bacterium]